MPVPVTPNFPVKGYAYTLEADKPQMKSGIVDIESNDLNILNVEGKSIVLLEADLSLDNERFIESEDGSVIAGLKNSNVRYGVKFDPESGERTIFVQGKPTTDMPNWGKVNYSGTSVLLKPDFSIETDGFAEFEADFTKKTLTGRVNYLFDEAYYELEASIKENSFEGTKDGVVTKGRFYGPGAPELGGVFHDTKTGASGAYAAERYNPEALKDPNYGIPQ